MCVQLPCGYSSQTLTKVIAYCGIVFYGCLISASALLGLIHESKRDLVQLRKSYYVTPEPNLDLSFDSDPRSEDNYDLSSSSSSSSSEESEEYETSTVATTTITTTTGLANLIGRDDGDLWDERGDLLQFLDITDPVETCFVLWAILSFVSGLVFSVILLQGAQERNLLKVKLWFYGTIVTYYILWLPFYIYYSVYHVDVLVCGFMAYMFGGVVLYIVAGFISELRIESISHRAGYKDSLVPFYKI